MSVPKPTHRTMWMVPRNIRQIKPWKVMQIATLLSACGGNAQGQEQQDFLYTELENLGLKSVKSDNGVPNPGGLRTYLAQLACLGLFWFDPKNKLYKTTPAGDELLEANNPVRILACQLLRMQYPSVYGNGHNVRVAPSLKVKPFVFLMNLLERKDLGKQLSSDEISICVVYGRTHKDEDLCARKILELRKVNDFKKVIDKLSDLCTPRRYEGPEDLLWTNGIADARDIGNTFKNYMLSAGLLEPTSPDSRYFKLHVSSEISDDIDRWRKESIEPAPKKGYEARWQLRFGRLDKQRVQIRPKCHSSFNSQVQAVLVSRYVSQAEAEPYGFDHDAFVRDATTNWNLKPTEVEDAVSAVKKKSPDIFRETMVQAAFSGGQEFLVLEKGVTNIFKRLGFDLSKHMGQKPAPNGREGGYPDVYIRASTVKGSAWADSKASARYGFPITDTGKLGTYYKHCWQEIDPSAAPLFFLYVAGGFEQKSASIMSHLQKGRQKYGYPVCAVTVEALCDLVTLPSTPNVAAIVKAFSKECNYFNSASQILQAAN